VRLQVPVDVRVRLLRSQYPHLEEDREGFKQQLARLVALYQDRRVGEWRALADAGRWDELVERLLLEHYDPAYHRSMLRNYARVGEALDIEIKEAADGALAEAAESLLLQVSLDRST
jgi:tRNA 2-selenouridine synthase